MPQERVTVSLDADAKAALDDLVDRTGAAQSEVVRRVLTFYATNFEAATATGNGSESDENLAEYHRMLTGGEHVLLDVDFLHAFLENVDIEDPDEAFIETVDRVSEYHAHEYADRFDDVGELLAGSHSVGSSPSATRRMTPTTSSSRRRRCAGS